MILATYRLAMDGLTATVMAAIRGMVRAFYAQEGRDEAVKALTPILTDVVRSHRSLAYMHAVHLLSVSAREQGVDDPYIPSQSGYSANSVRSVLREQLRGAPDDAAKAVGERLTQHVESAARETITRAVEDGRAPADREDAEHWSPNAVDPDDFEDAEDAAPRGQRALSWARVLTGAENCAFCVMLASRGPVYSGPDEAGRMLASDKWPDAKGYINSFHDNCDCVVVPIYDFNDWPGRESYRALDDWYQQTIANPLYRGERVGARAGSKDDPTTAKNPSLAALDRELRDMAKRGESLPISDLRSL